MEEINETITEAKNFLKNSWNKIEEKGGMVAKQKNMVNLPTAIRSIKEHK